MMREKAYYSNSIIALIFSSLFLVGCINDELNPKNWERYTTDVHLRGQLVDSCGGAPTSGIKIFWYDNTSFVGSSQDELIGETVTDENGYFEILNRPYEYVSNTKKEGITGVSDSYLTVCLPDETFNQEIASGFLGSTKFSEGNHDSNGDVGVLYAYRGDIQFQMNLPKLSPDGNPMDYYRYVHHSGGWIKSIEQNTTNPDWTIFNCTYRYWKKLYLRDLNNEQPELHNGYNWLSNANIELIDSTAGKKVIYYHDVYRFPNCGENGIIYPDYKESKDL